MQPILREDSLYLQSMASIIDNSADQERALTYITLLVKPHCDKLKLSLPIKGKTAAEVSSRLKYLSHKHYKTDMVTLSGRINAPSFRRKIAEEGTDEQQIDNSIANWQKNTSSEYELMKGNTSIGIVRVLKLDDKKVEDGKRYEWKVYGTDKRGYEKYLYKAQKNVELSAIQL
jgi:hypothetical protein